VYIERGDGTRIIATPAQCSTFTGSFTLTPTGDRSADIAGNVRLECAINGAAISADVTFTRCHGGE
jgi:hypothetical protein